MKTLLVAALVENNTTKPLVTVRLGSDVNVADGAAGKLHVSSQRGLTWIPAWALCCQVPSRLLGVFAGASSIVLTLIYTFPPLLSFIIIILTKHQVHPRHGLPGDAGRASGWWQPRLLDKRKKKFRGDGWRVGWFNICQCSAVLFSFSADSRSPGWAAGAEWRTKQLHLGCRSSAGCWVSRSGNGFDGRGKTRPPEGAETNTMTGFETTITRLKSSSRHGRS